MSGLTEGRNNKKEGRTEGMKKGRMEREKEERRVGILEGKKKDKETHTGGEKEGRKKG